MDEERQPLLLHDEIQVLEHPRGVSYRQLTLTGILLGLLFVLAQVSLGLVQNYVNSLTPAIKMFHISEITQTGFNAKVQIDATIPLTPDRSHVVLVEPATRPESTFPFGLRKWSESPLSVTLASIDFEKTYFSNNFSAHIQPRYFHYPTSSAQIRLQTPVTVFGLNIPTWTYFNSENAPMQGSITPEVLRKDIEMSNDPDSLLPKYTARLQIRLQNTSPILMTPDLSDFSCELSYESTPFASVLTNRFTLREGGNAPLTVKIETIAQHWSTLSRLIQEYSSGENVKIEIHNCTLGDDIAWLKGYLVNVRLPVTITPSEDSWLSDFVSGLVSANWIS